LATPGQAEKGAHVRRGYLGYLSVLAASALFGSVFTVAKVPLESIDPLLLAGVLYAVSGLSLVPFARASFRLERRELKYMALITAFGAVGAPVLLLYGLQQTSASDASILTNGEVLFTVILASVFFGERPHGRTGAFAVALVIAGLFMATTDMEFSATIIAFNAGNVMILASMFLWAIDNNISRKLTVFSTISPAKIAMIKSLAGGLVMLAAASAAGRAGGLVQIDLNLWLIIAGLAAAGFGGALLFFLEGIKRIGTIKTMSVFSTTPIFGIAIAALTLGESISAFQAIATGLIITGILLVSRR
jgi:drug/metabolite transporter (DMT)-like permease